MGNIAWSLCRELTRNKIFSLIVVFGVGLILLSIALSRLTLGDGAKLILDFGLSMMEIIGVLATLYIGSQILFQEISGRTVYLLFSKPLSRSAFILGKVLGFAIVLAAIIAFQAGMLGLILAFRAPEFLTGFFVLAVVFMYIKLVMLFAIVLFFSVFLSPMVTILATLGVYFIAHATYDIHDLAKLSGDVEFQVASRTLAVIFPNFEGLNIKNAIQFPGILPEDFLLVTLSTSALYLALVLVATVFLFERKTFEN